MPTANPAACAARGATRGESPTGGRARKARMARKAVLLVFQELLMVSCLAVLAACPSTEVPGLPLPTRGATPAPWPQCYRRGICSGVLRCLETYLYHDGALGRAYTINCYPWNNDNLLPSSTDRGPGRAQVGGGIRARYPRLGAQGAAVVGFAAPLTTCGRMAKPGTPLQSLYGLLPLFTGTGSIMWLPSADSAPFSSRAASVKKSPTY